MKVTQMPPVHAANLVANSGNTAYRADVIGQVWREVVGCRNWPVMRVPHFIALRRNDYIDVITSMMASQITRLMIVYSTVYSDADQRKHQSSRLLAFVQGIHRWPVISPPKGPVMPKMFPFDYVIMIIYIVIKNNNFTQS